jgi:hypothetical protein
MTRLTIYGVDDLPVYRIGSSGDPVFDPSTLVMYLKQNVDAESWGRDGHGLVVNRASKSLFIHQTLRNHAAIESILHRVALFCRPISEASIQETIALAKRTNRRVLLLVSGPEANFAVASIAVLEGAAFAKVSENYLLRCLTTDRADQVRKAVGDGEATFENGLYVIGGDGLVIEQLAADDGQADEVAIRAFLKRSAVPLPTAETVLAAGLEAAAAEKKKVLLIVSGPGCVHCIRFKAFLNEHGQAFSKDYVQAVVDTRMPDSEIVSRRFGRTDDDIPWYAVIDSKGQVSVTSESATGNIGFPIDDDDRAHFRGMFNATRQKMSDAELQQVFRALGG